MRFVTYQIDSKISKISRVGILINFDQTEIVLDLNLSFASLLKEQGKEPKYLDYANFRIPHNMCDFMAGGDPSIEAAKETLEYIKIIGIDYNHNYKEVYSIYLVDSLIVCYSYY